MRVRGAELENLGWAVQPRLPQQFLGGLTPALSQSTGRGGKRRTAYRLVFVFVLACLSCASVRADDKLDPGLQPTAQIKSVKNFMYQIEGLTDPAAVDKLAGSGYDMVIVAPTFDVKGNEKFHASSMVKALHDAKPGRLVIATLNIGQAENFRTYWTATWHGENSAGPAVPGYLLGADPNSGADTFLVRFWRPRWQNIFLGPRGLIHRIMGAGFDGVCVQGLDAYDNDPIDVAADREKIDPSKSMLDFVTAVRTHVRQAKSDGIVLALNASDFLDDQPGFAKAIDGLVAEDTWFSGSDDAKWDDPTAGDQPNNDSDEDSTTGLIRQYHKFLDAGVPVFTIDYCVKPQNADRVYRESAREGFIPLVTRVSADNVTTTPPPGDAAPNPSTPTTQP